MCLDPTVIGTIEKNRIDAVDILRQRDRNLC